MRPQVVSNGIIIGNVHMGDNIGNFGRRRASTTSLHAELLHHPQLQEINVSSH